MANIGSEVGLQCADCSAEAPTWASINRGVLICAECCSVHRNLGRHVSQIRSIKKGVWEQPQLELVFTLHQFGANRVWEHALQDPNMAGKYRRKPTPFDPVFPVKEAFIKAKYQDFAYTFRPSKDDSPLDQDDLNRQLWSCVRTGHVETTLRLLFLGADPNYADPSSRNTPAHIAAKEGQPLQIELLCIYGAELSALNNIGFTPSQVAKASGFNDLSNRIVELCFEITDKFSSFLCGRKPDHTKQQHFLVPDLTGNSALRSLKTLRLQLRAIPYPALLSLMQDVYDEIDRRETAASWAVATRNEPNLGNEHFVAVFLPPNPNFTPIRNQLRQKLAKYDTGDFAILIIDLLKEIKRRHYNEPCDDTEETNDEPVNTSGILNSQRDYDDVAICTAEAINAQQNQTKSDIDDDANLHDEVLELRERISMLEEQISKVTDKNDAIIRLMSGLQMTIESLRSENWAFRNEIARLADLQQSTLSRHPPMSHSHLPTSAYAANGSTSHNTSLTQPHSNSDAEETSRRLQRKSATPSGRRSVDHTRELNSAKNSPFDREKESPFDRDLGDRFSNKEYARNHVLSSQSSVPDKIVVETERLTHFIRVVLNDAQTGELQIRAPKHANNICNQVHTLLDMLPSNLPSANEAAAVLASSSFKFRDHCNDPNFDSELTCQAAFGLAKAAKGLLEVFIPMA